MVRSKKKPTQNSTNLFSNTSSSDRIDSSIPIVQLSDSDDESSAGPDTQVFKRRKSAVKEKTLYECLNKTFSLKINLFYTEEKSIDIYCLFGEIFLKVKNIDFENYDENKILYLFINESQETLYFENYATSSKESNLIGDDHMSSTIDRNDLKVQSNNAGSLEIEETLPFNFWKVLGNKSQFQVIINSYKDLKYHLQIYLLNGALMTCLPSETSPGNKLLGEVCHYFYGIEYPLPMEQHHSYIDADILYEEIKRYHKGKCYYQGNVQHRGLVPMLRPYQISAVKWMLSQEKGTFDDNNETLHELYVEFVSKDGKALYYNKFGCYFLKERPLMVKQNLGGILADEMGLGKTVEILACILNNPCLQYDNYVVNGIASDTRHSLMDHTKIHCDEEEPDRSLKLDDKSGHEHGEITSLKYEGEKSINDSYETEKSNVPMISVKDESEISNDRPRRTKSFVNYEDDLESSSFVRSRNGKVSSNSNDKFKRKKACRDYLFDVSDSEGTVKVKDDAEKSNDRPRRIKSFVNYTENLNYEDDLESSSFFPSQKGKLSSKSSDKSKRKKVSNNDEPNLDFEVKKCRPKVSTAYKFDVDREIKQCPMKSVIEKVIIENVWDNNLSNYKKEGSFKQYINFLKMRKKDPLYMMTLKERLNIQYINSIEAYSATNSLIASRSRCEGFFDTKVKQKSFFECVCGIDDRNISNTQSKIQCSICKLYQHAECVHYNQNDPSMGDYICPHCWSEQDLLQSRTTLIISPASICYQWHDEIKKHLTAKSLKVLIYKGVAVHGYFQPKQLVRYDIVITTYEVLRRELNYVDLPHSNSEAGRKFRFPKRFMAIPSPLPCIEWFRICLDEAQMVECTSTKTAEMCLRLRAKIKWCITGTPIQKSINDLQGLLMFLNVDPYGISKWWNLCLYNLYCREVFEPLHKVMVQLMWRTSKRDVFHELGLPAYTEEIHWLNFTPVEEHFYKRLHSDCSSEAITKLKRFSDHSIHLKSLDRQTLSFILQPLLKLRQACDHPQIVKGHFLSLNKKTMTMEQLLENLLKKTQVEAEDAHRIIIASLNGLAALHIIKEEFLLAIQKYRETMLAIEEDGKYLKTDLLQKLHTLHNLEELLKANHNGVEKTLRDDSLLEESKALKKKYLVHHPIRIEEAKLECSQITSSIEELGGEMKNKSWWLAALEVIDHEFVLELRQELLAQYSRFQEHQCILFSVESRPQLMRVLNTEVKKLQGQRKTMIDGIMSLIDITDYDTLVNSAIECHLRPTDNSAPKCTLCVRHELFEDFEKTLFFVKDTKIARKTDTSKEVDKNIENLDATRKGNWGLGEIEKILKYLQTKSLCRVYSSIHEDSQSHLAMIHSMKKEFKLYRVFWRTIYDYVSAIDEVSMATLRFRLRFPGEVVPEKKKIESKDLSENTEKPVPIYILDKHELPQTELKLKSDQIINRNELRAKMSQILYLNSLKTEDMGRKGGLNPEKCPICKGILGEKWAVFQCGHSFCVACIGLYLSHKKRNCPMCRQPTNLKDITYVDTAGSEPEQHNIKIQGSLSTKIEGVVRTMLKIKATDPQAKILVFSSWTDVLDVIADGLTQNGIIFRVLNTNNKFQVNLEAFKTKQEITVLLMPLSLGANGLNLVEACHVVLVEPILNPAAEVQAIGRIHRIGQTKSTVIHRFIVRSTIEERMHQILSPLHQMDSKEDHSMTIQNLRQLFLIQNEDIPLELSSTDRDDLTN